jgi:N-carbamoylputrescine amidase
MTIQRTVTVAATQFSCSWNISANLDRAESLVRKAVDQGAQIVLLQELFETPYFCSVQKSEYYDLARSISDNATLARFQSLARELGVVLPISFYERENVSMFNAVVLFDADGRAVGHYRKSHIPQFPGYEEKYYFSPGDTGFRVFDTAVGRIGIGICWDQWFPEAARLMALKGAELLLYPTAIGSEPAKPELDSRRHWQRCMQGHAAANLVPVIASNRIGQEDVGGVPVRFYGSSFIADHTGALLKEADDSAETILTATIDLEATRRARIDWGVFRDRRTDLYKGILSMDGAIVAGG